jgi:cobalt-zinc-cadmium efflux system protein
LALHEEEHQTHEHIRHHHAHPQATGLRLGITVGLNWLIAIIELSGGILSGSLSLLSDALHNFSDGFSVLIAYFAILLGRKDHTAEKTFGYKRAEIIAALFNACVLIFITIFLFKEAIPRFFHPVAINSTVMIWVALVGVIANTVGALILHKNSKDSINIKSAYLHLISDVLSSVAVLIGGIGIYFFHVLWLDPLLTVLICVYILLESYKIVKQTMNILIQAAPLHIDVEKVAVHIKTVPNVLGIHHIHVWQLSDHQIHLEGHLEIHSNFTICEGDEIRSKVEEILLHDYGINHVTLQIESDVCPNKNTIHQH